MFFLLRRKKVLQSKCLQVPGWNGDAFEHYKLIFDHPPSHITSPFFILAKKLSYEDRLETDNSSRLFLFQNDSYHLVCCRLNNLCDQRDHVARCSGGKCFDFGGNLEEPVAPHSFLCPSWGISDHRLPQRAHILAVYGCDYGSRVHEYYDTVRLLSDWGIPVWNC